MDTDLNSHPGETSGLLLNLMPGGLRPGVQGQSYSLKRSELTMAKFRGDRVAFKPGIEPRWTRGSKDGVGTAYASSSRIWFTVWNGIITEVYYPTVDMPQIRDLQYLITDGSSFFHDEQHHLRTHTECPWPNVLAYRVINSDPEDRYQIKKEIITDPHLSCVLQHTKLGGDPQFLSRLRLYVLCAPHLGVGGWGNNGYVVEAAGRSILAAEKHGTWLALAATVPFRHLSCGYVGQSDGWTDINSNLQMDWDFDRAPARQCCTNGRAGLKHPMRIHIGSRLGR